MLSTLIDDMPCNQVLFLINFDVACQFYDSTDSDSSKRKLILSDSELSPDLLRSS